MDECKTCEKWRRKMRFQLPFLPICPEKKYNNERINTPYTQNEHISTKKERRVDFFPLRESVNWQISFFVLYSAHATTNSFTTTHYCAVYMRNLHIARSTEDIEFEKTRFERCSRSTTQAPTIRVSWIFYVFDILLRSDLLVRATLNQN